MQYRASIVSAQILAAGVLGATAQAVNLECATISAGAMSDANGRVVNIGELVIGVAARDGVQMHAGIVRCLEFTSEPPVSCLWDCDGSSDGVVGITDFLALLAQWGQVGNSCDFDGGGVGVTDFLEMLANWGPCP